MRLAQNVKGTPRLAMMLLLIISFLLGATLSYIYTMGFYAPSEFNLPNQTNITVEDVKFFAENATFFNVTLLNPSYSLSPATIEQIKVETAGGKLHDTTTPSLPVTLARGSSQTIVSLWNWCNYTGQTVRVHVYASEGLGSNSRKNTPFMNFSVTSTDFNPSVSVNHFNITVQNTGSSTLVNVTEILVNRVSVSSVPSLTPNIGLANASGAPTVSFMLMKNWTDLQGKTVAIEVQTLQGYSAYEEITAPPPMVLKISDVHFNVSYTDRFDITIQNSESSPQNFVDINEIKLLIENETNVPNVSLPQKLQWNSSITLTCFWNWSSYEGKNVTILVMTTQGFTLRDSVAIIPEPKVSFVRWADNARVDTLNYTVDLAPSVKITNENITHGIWNWDITAHTAYVRVFNITNSAYIQNVTIHVKLGNEIMATISWNSSVSLPTSWVSFSASASAIYTIWIEISTTPEAVVGQTSVVALEIKTQNP